MPNLTLSQWKYILIAVVVVDLLIVGGLSFFLAGGADSQAASSTVSSPLPVVVTVVVTPTPWNGPGRHPDPTATLPPTPTPTNALAASGFPPGFTPTPRPTREPVFITLPQIFAAGRKAVDVPVINQIYYPEPFFPPGTNNACGPIALFAGLSALKPDIQYSRLRDLAVSYGFNAEGITKSGLINTATTLNSELGSPFTLEYGDRYRTTDLIKKLRQGAVVVILVRVKREAGVFRVTDDYYYSFGHFMLVDQINTRAKYVKVAGSTLGMDRVPLPDFIRAWSGETPPSAPLGWRPFLQNERADNWALIIKRAKAK